jgi:hypothetical protein
LVFFWESFCSPSPSLWIPVVFAWI